MGVLERLIGKPLHEVTDEELQQFIAQLHKTESVRSPKRISTRELEELLSNVNFDDMEV